MPEKCNSSGRTVAICDDPASVDFLCGRATDRQADDWLALTPPVAEALSERGMKYLVVDDFFAEADLQGDIDERFDKQVQWAVWLDAYLRERVPQFAQVNFSPGLVFFFSIKNFFDRFKVALFGLQAFLDAYQPNRIIWVSTARAIPKELHAIGSHFVDGILPALAKERNIDISIVKLPDEANSELSTEWQKRWTQAKYSLKMKGKEIWDRVSIRYSGWRLARKNRNKSREIGPAAGRKLLVLQHIYEMAFVLPHLAAAGVHLLYPSLNKMAAQSKKIDDEGIKTALARVWEEITREPNFWGLLEGWQPGNELVKPWLARLWFQSFYEYWQGLQQARDYLENETVHGVVVANTLGQQPFGLGMGFLKAARLAGIPIFSSPHGSLPGYCRHPFMAVLDLPHADYYFAHGEGVAKYLQEVAERYSFPHAAMVAVGSPTADSIRNNYRPAKAAALRRKLAGSESRPLILHIPGFLYYHRRLSGDEFSCMPYFALQKQIIEVFAEFKNVRLVYRSYSGQWPDLVPGLVKRWIPDAIIAGSDIRLTDLMWAVDGIILDYPATPLAEVLLTDKPIIVLAHNRYYEMFEEAKELLRKRAKIIETSEEYLKAIREFLSNNDFNNHSMQNNEFRRHYLTNKDDGKAAERVAGFILDVISSKG